MDGDLREQGYIRFYQVTGKKTITLGRICSLRWLPSLSRDELEEGSRKGSLKYTSPLIRDELYFRLPFLKPSSSSSRERLGNKVIRIPECGEFLLLELDILGFGIRNSAQGIRNPFNDWTPESRSTQSFTWCSPGNFSQGDHRVHTKNCNHFLRTFQGPPTRNLISLIVQKCTFPVHSNRT